MTEPFDVIGTLCVGCCFISDVDTVVTTESLFAEELLVVGCAGSEENRPIKRYHKHCVIKRYNVS